MGDLVAAPGGGVAVEFAIAAAQWVPVDEVRLLLNGEVVRRFTAADLAEDEVVRLLGAVDLALERDGFITLEAGVPLDVDPDAWAAERGGVYAATVAPGFVPTAFANPIFIDADGNGRFDPPGLPPPQQDWSALRTGLSVGAAGLVLGLWWLRWRRA